ncbi:MAG: hypothetical protein KBF43_13860 [Dermatophilaceae bacterium]|nr:hypothetical protein [Actinomycetales bacterium]MBP9919669.1 hypothetical protein [Dermatophilaceae bacterium]
MRLLAMSGLTLLASAMVPVQPLDGGFLSAKRWEVGVSVALILGSIGFTTGLI